MGDADSGSPNTLLVTMCLYLPCSSSTLESTTLRNRMLEHVDRADWLQVEYFKKQRVVNYQKEQTIKRIESQGGEIVAPQLPLPSSK
jgi:hypothetical protein